GGGRGRPGAGGGGGGPGSWALPAAGGHPADRSPAPDGRAAAAERIPAAPERVRGAVLPRHAVGRADARRVSGRARVVRGAGPSLRRMTSFLFQLLRKLTVPHWTTHWVRPLLTVIGVALGVGTIVAVSDISSSVLSSFRDMVDTVAGASALEITSPAGHVDEGLVAVAAKVPGVREAAGLVE